MWLRLLFVLFIYAFIHAYICLLSWVPVCVHMRTCIWNWVRFWLHACFYFTEKMKRVLKIQKKKNLPCIITFTISIHLLCCFIMIVIIKFRQTDWVDAFLETPITRELSREQSKSENIILVVFIGNHFLRWGFLIWELILLRTFVLILVGFFVVFLTTFRPNFTSGRLQMINRDLG